MSAPRERASPRRDGAIVYVCGSPGNGKTTLVARILARECRSDGHWRQCVLYDPTGDLVDRLTGETAGDRKHTISKDDVRVVQTAVEARKALAGESRMWSPAIRTKVVAFQPSSRVKLEQLAEEWLATVDDKSAKGLVWAADEAQLIWPSEPPRGSKLQVLTLVRNRQQLALTTTQRPQYTATILRSNASHVCVFGGDSRRYVDPGCAEFGDPEVFEPALKLPQFRYLYRAPRRLDPMAPLPAFDARTDRIPW